MTQTPIVPPIVPPPPGLDKEEPTFVQEQDIPSDNPTGVDDDWQSPLGGERK